MLKNPVLVVMAAGMGSRYGGLKQIDPVGPSGQIILDYSLYDAHKAGFRKVIFIIKPELQDIFEEAVGTKARRLMEVTYVYQTLNVLPNGLCAPEGREKPLGTGHAIYCVRDAVDAPFAVINADDFYGSDAFAKMYRFLSALPEAAEKLPCCMVGYRVENTLTENGTVSRGVCATDVNGFLTDICERTAISRGEDGIIHYAADGEAPAGEITEGTPVSMNLWGFPADFLDELDTLLRAFFADTLPQNPQKAEFYLPTAVHTLLRADRATAKVLTTDSHWFGITYREDKPQVCAAIGELTAKGVYPA